MNQVNILNMQTQMHDNQSFYPFDNFYQSHHVSNQISHTQTSGNQRGYPSHSNIQYQPHHSHHHGQHTHHGHSSDSRVRHHSTDALNQHLRGRPSSQPSNSHAQKSNDSAFNSTTIQISDKIDSLQNIVQSAIRDISIHKGKDALSEIKINDEMLQNGHISRKEKEKIIHHLYQLGMSFYQKGQYKSAEEFFQKAGQLGCSSSLYRLGILYMSEDLGENREVVYSYRKAFDCFAKAGEMGHSGAVTNIGTLFFNAGKFKEALDYYNIGANMGCLYAYKNIGKMYESGNGVKKDNLIALEYFQKCGSQRHIERATRNILNETCFGAI